MENQITLTELESAINYWRQQSPSIGEELRLCKEASSLATPYAMMILAKRQTLPFSELGENARKAYEAWVKLAKSAG